jgi:GH25 family lysozyme M1 (1,4-beta-N-acetylmuramidase)
VLASALCASAVPAASASPVASAAPAVPADRPALPRVLGIDVSAYQHARGAVIDWRQVARAGVRFVAIKVTEGTYYTNPYYRADARAAIRMGLYVAPYVFANPYASGGARQASFALARTVYPLRGPMLPLVVDLEPDPYTRQEHVNACYGLNKKQMTGWITAFAAQTRRVSGRSPIIYTTASWWRQCTGNGVTLRRDPLWVAAYDISRPEMPAGWRSWTFWQYQKAARVNGITYRGGVDLSYASSFFAVLTGHRPHHRKHRKHRHLRHH